MRAERAKADVLNALAAVEPELEKRIVGFADQVTTIRSYVGEAAALSAGDLRTALRDRYGAPEWVLFSCALGAVLIPLAASFWLNNHYRWWEYLLIGIGVFYLGGAMVIILGSLARESSGHGSTAIRRLIVTAAAAATVFFIVRWHGGHLGGWVVIALGLGLLVIPAEIGFTQARHMGPQLDQLQVLALAFVELLYMVHRAAQQDTNPPRALVDHLEHSAKRVLASCDRAARDWPSTDPQVRSQIREFGGSVAAGLRWHKRLVIMPTADASAALFVSFGYGLAAAVGADWQRLMFEPALSAAQSFWERYRVRIAIAAVLGAVTAATFVFPHLLPSGIESQVRGLLVLTAVFSLLGPPGESFGHAYDAVGNIFSSSAASKLGK